MAQFDFPLVCSADENWKLESLANSKEISAILFRTEKGGLPLEEVYNFRMDFVPFDFQLRFPEFFAKW